MLNEKWFFFSPLFFRSCRMRDKSCISKITPYSVECNTFY
jgi:hypothetical protein